MTGGPIPLDPDRPAPADLFDEWIDDDLSGDELVDGDDREEISKMLADVAYCRCDWTYHRGRSCGNVLNAPSQVLVEPQLCAPCLYSCQAEREEMLANDSSTWREDDRQ